MKLKEFIIYKSFNREANEKRHKHFTTLIKTISSLIDDELFYSTYLLPTQPLKQSCFENWS